MNKKKWALLLLCAILIFGYIKLFYKTYSNNVVAQSANCIIAIDVKRITNTLIWDFLTTPGQWKPGNIFKRSTGKAEVSWKDMIKIPDYIFAFNVKGQPLKNWYSVLTIKNTADFEKGLLRYHFAKQKNSQYNSEELGLSFFKFDNKILVSNNKEDNGYLEQIAAELFTKKSYIDKATLEKAIDAKSHAVFYIPANKYLQQDGIVTANFSKQAIKIGGKFSPAKEYNFNEQEFSFSGNSLFALGFTQPAPAVYNLIDNNSKTKISKALNLDIDSLFRPDNKYYSLNLTDFKSRADSAISYSYDEDFNKVEKVVVNNILEPAYHFNTIGDSTNCIYNYFLSSNKIEQTNSGDLFTPMPFVKSYCSNNNNLLNIQSANYIQQKADNKITGIIFMQLLLSKMPAEMLKFLPGQISKTISNIDSLKLTAFKKDNTVEINCVLHKKNNDLPILKF